jgi:hypothetical protein
VSSFVRWDEGPRLCGLASVRRDPFLLGLLELGLLLPFVHLRLLRNSRKMECGAGQFFIRLVVRTAPFALLG